MKATFIFIILLWSIVFFFNTNKKKDYTIKKNDLYLIKNGNYFEHKDKSIYNPFCNDTIIILEFSQGWVCYQSFSMNKKKQKRIQKVNKVVYCPVINLYENTRVKRIGEKPKPIKKQALYIYKNEVKFDNRKFMY